LRKRVIRSIGVLGVLGLLSCRTAWAAGFETVILKDGQRITGEIVAEKSNALYVDLGYDLLRIPRDQVLRRTKIEEADTGHRSLARSAELDTSGFYTTGLLKPAGVKDLVTKYGEAVVSIETPSGKGSGFIINKDGYAITNAHVIQGETRVSAILYLNTAGGLNRRRIEDVEIIALNPFFDLALLKLPLPSDVKPSHVVLGSGDDVNAGDSVFAVGNPLGLERTVTQGIVSNRSRDIEGQIFLQTDAAINPGNSGGPLFNQRGEVIGVNSRGAHAAMADNLGFAIPVNYVKQFLHHREAFSFDKANPNSGYRYPDPPRRRLAARPEGLKAKPGDAKASAAESHGRTGQSSHGEQKGASR
jgi:serine protease Do